MQAVFETLFDIVYLITVITLGICIIRGNRGRRQYLLYGVMAVTLGCGDAFHLVPPLSWASGAAFRYVWAVVIGYRAMKQERADA